MSAEYSSKIQARTPPKILSVFQNQYFVIFGITLFAALLRFYHLTYKSLWLDEAKLFWISQGSIEDVLSKNAASNSAPPLFAILINLMSSIGNNEFILRSIPWMAGILSIPAMYYLSRQILPRNSAYFPVLIVAITTTQVKYSQELREYSLTFLLAILILASFYVYSLEPGWKNGLILAGVWIIAVFTQYGLSILLIALNIIFIIDSIISKNKFHKLIKWFAIQLIVFVAVVIVYELSLKHQFKIGFGATSGSHYLTDAYWNGSLFSLPKHAIKNTNSILNFAYPVYSLFIFIFILGMFAIVHTRKWRVLSMVFVPMVITFIASCYRLYPYIGDRQVIYLTPMIYICTGFGLSYLWNLEKNKIAAFLIIFILALGGIKATYQYLTGCGQENIKPVLETLSNSIRADDRIYVYYGAIPAFSYYHQNNNHEWISGVISRGDPDGYFTQLDNLLVKEGRVWMIFSHCFDTECELIPSYVSTKRTVKLESQDEGIKLYLAY